MAPLLARWHVAEWAHLYDGWTYEVALAELESMGSGVAPSTWVACSGGGRTPEDVLGSVSLIESDDLPGFDHLSPWLASLYVVPSARSHGVGAALVLHLLEAARRTGIAKVYLFTAGQEDYYLARGWQRVASAEVNGHAVTVMTHDC